ncbi:MAG: hypothetical protein KF785_12825 [Gemmatimonadales bacterium]|nr:hypothetical protein [Gemmatimonadales bacterium]
MKQNLILALFAFLMAIAGATWFSVFVAPERPPAVAEAPTDSVPTSRAAVGDTSIAASVAALMTRADSAPTATVVSSATEPVVDSRGAREVAKILITMKPKAAAEIIEKLTDDEVETIVRQLNAKQVATLLGSLPHERAAMLSRRLLTPTAPTRGGT